MKCVVFIHDDADGFASGVAAMVMYYRNQDKYEDFKVYRVQYHQPVPDALLDKETDLFILDFSYSIEILNSLKEKVNSILVIDHHKTALEALAGFDDKVYDTTKSGAVLSWETLNPGIPVPYFVKLVGDYDLHTFEYEDSLPFDIAVKASGLDKEMSFWYGLYTTDMVSGLIKQGLILKEAQDNTIKAFVKSRKYKIAKFQGHRCAIYNTTTLKNELAVALYSDPELDLDMTMSYFVTSDGAMVFNLRSSNKSTVDVGAIAKTFGAGGGHEHAAGFSMPLVQGASFISLLLKD